MNIREIYKSILGYFFRGLLYTVPVAITGYIVYNLFVYFDSLIPTRWPGLGILILVGFITLMGVLGSTIIVQPLVEQMHRVIARIPVLNTIYTSLNDLLSAFVGAKKRFDKPVLVKLNKENDLEKLGFITAENLSSLGINGGKIAVFLPHSYNISGNLYIVPKENVTPLSHSATDVMKFIISGGVTEIEE